MAPYDRNSGSNKTGQAALPHKNIHLSFVVLYWLSRFFALNFLGCQLAEPLETKMGEMVYLLVAGKALSWFLLSLLLVRIVFDIVLYLSDHYWCLGFFC